MPLESITNMTKKAMADGYAVGYFESWNFSSLQGVIDAAEETKSPIIVGFNGDFLSDPNRIAVERLSWYGAMARAAAESATVPCCVLFNECGRYNKVKEALDAGFNLVMPVGHDGNYDQYVKNVKEIVQYAHSKSAAVEGEMDELPCGLEDGDQGDPMTDPDLAAKFVEETGIDILAVSVGNVHIKLDGQQGLNLERLAAVKSKVSIPLDLHGGTGITSDSVKEAIKLGVAKMTYGTYIKQRYLNAVRKALGSDCSNPHKLLAMGGKEDVMVAGRAAVKDAVLERIGLLGCCGKA